MDKKLRWFDEGAATLRPVLERIGHSADLPATGDYYACPCCLVAYGRDAVAAGILTVEHVPPKALGGRGLVLTCRDCNSVSGTNFDAHAARRAEADDFIRGTAGRRALRATVYADGIPLRGTVQRTESGFQIFGVPKQNDPRVQAAHFKALDAYSVSGSPNPNVTFTVHTQFDETRARYSWIRSAYLAAFAALGWSYILRPIMKPVRQQLKKPDAKILPTYLFRDPNTSAQLRRVLLVNDPDEVRCVAVVFGEHTVFMPGLFGAMTWDELAAAFSRRCEDGDRLNVTLNGNEVPWPSRPTYLLD